MSRVRPTRASRLVEEWLASGSEVEPHTQEILAKLLSERVGREVSQSSVSKIKNGEQLPRADLVAAFRVTLGIEPEWWLPLDNESGPALPGAA
mgnify:CR=1 FL=1